MMGRAVIIEAMTTVTGGISFMRNWDGCLPILD